MSRGRYTRSGARRSGDDYQDIVALDMIVDMLEHPTRYEWIRVEADDVGCLDDVVGMQSDGTLALRQVKYSTNPEADNDPWSIDSLLETRVSKSGNQLPSLLFKWASSVLRELDQGTSVKACVMSNRRAAADFAQALIPEGFIDIDRIACRTTRARVIEQVGNEEDARRAFSVLRFDLDLPGLDVFEQGVIRRFTRLSGSSEGWLRLKEDLRSWVRERYLPHPDGNITLRVARCAAQWYELRDMPEQFPIPPDFVLPSQSFHISLMARLREMQSGCIVLTASPGVGKSTYLSFVNSVLKEEEIAVIRHHYYLSMSDRTTGRRQHVRVAESLMHDIEAKHPESVSEVTQNDPRPGRDLSVWIEASGRFLAGKGEKLVIILDGLDHVWREDENIHELEALFENLFPVPDGVVLLLGTQPVDETLLPNTLRQHAPRNGWLELPHMERKSVNEWVLKHSCELLLSSEDDARERQSELLTDAFWEQSAGHPLYLHYTLRALGEQNLVVSADTIRQLPSCPHPDVTAYYGELWARLPIEGQEILHLMATCVFPWPKSGIQKVLSLAGRSLPDTVAALRKVRHLMRYTQLGLEAFHSSIFVFVRSSPEHVAFRSQFVPRALVWLRSFAPEYWRWAYYWLLEADAGNQALLVDSPDHAWVVQTLEKRYPFADAERTLSRAGLLALEGGNLARFVRLGLMLDYIRFVYEYRIDVYDELLATQLAVDTDRTLYLILCSDLEALGDSEVADLAYAACEQNDLAVVDYCLTILRERLNETGRPGRHRRSTMWTTTAEHMLHVAALLEDIDHQKVVEFIRAQSYGTMQLTMAYVNSVKRCSDTERMRRLINAFAEESPAQLGAVVETAVALFIDEGCEYSDVLDKYKSMSTLLALLAGVSSKNVVNDPWTLPSDGLIHHERHKLLDEQGELDTFFRDALRGMLVNHIGGHHHNNDEWCSGLFGHPWPIDFLYTFNKIAAEAAVILQNDEYIAFGWLWNQIGKQVSKMTWEVDRDDVAYWHSARRAVLQLAFDLQTLCAVSNHLSAISPADLDSALSSGMVFIDELLARIISMRKPCLTDGAVTWLMEKMTRESNASVEEFPGRGRRYARAATVCSIHSQPALASQCIRESADSLYSYGEHKDTLLHHALKAIDICSDAGVGRAREWLLRISVPIGSIKDFTDRDETDALPSMLADSFSKVDPSVIPHYYDWLCLKEEYYDAQQVFHTYVGVADLGNEVDQALAATGIDTVSTARIAERAISDPNARIVLANIRAVLGEANQSPALEETQPAQGMARQIPAIDDNTDPSAIRTYLYQGGDYYQSAAAKMTDHWLDHWEERGRLTESFVAIEREVDLGLYTGAYGRLFQIAKRLYGKARAYPWLVRDAADGRIWHTYSSSHDAATWCWDAVKTLYPDRWYQFIIDTLNMTTGKTWGSVSAYDSVPRLVEYCIFMGEQDHAALITEQIVNMMVELVSAQPMPVPAWLGEVS